MKSIGFDECDSECINSAESEKCSSETEKKCTVHEGDNAIGLG